MFFFLIALEIITINKSDLYVVRQCEAVIYDHHNRKHLRRLAQRGKACLPHSVSNSIIRLRREQLLSYLHCGNIAEITVLPAVLLARIRF